MSFAFAKLFFYITYQKGGRDIANLTATFGILDNMSSTIASIAQAGLSMTEQFERAGGASSFHIN